MVIVKTHGGLGNQLFQYAAGKALADYHGTEFKFEISPLFRYGPSEYCLDKFNLIAPVVTKEEVEKYSSLVKEPQGLKKFFLDRFNFLTPYLNFLRRYKKIKVYQERFFHFNKRFFELPADVYLIGYFQSAKYFERVKDRIRQEFTLKDRGGEAFNKFADEIQSSNSVSIHFRRGDYVTDRGINSIFGVPEIKYYQDAVNLVASRVPNPNFFVFSNDHAWVKNNFFIRYPVVYVADPNLAFYEEMVLMSKCKHNIIANSSFSWWGAWLNNHPEKIVVAPKRWFKWWKFNCKDIIPDGWFKL